jgi:hypothetical protein
MATNRKPRNGLMFHTLRTEQLLSDLRAAIAPFRQLSPKIVMALGPTGERTPEQFEAAEDCLKKAYCMLVDVQWFLSEYDDPDTLADELDDGKEDDTTTPNPEEDEDECE